MSQEKGEYLRKIVRQRLIEVAKKGSTINYKAIYQPLGIARGGHPNAKSTIGNIVGDISKSEYSNKRPLLSSIVVHKTDGYPAGNFFGLNGIPEQLQRDEKDYRKPLTSKEKEFVKEEQKRVWDYWKKHYA